MIQAIGGIFGRHARNDLRQRHMPMARNFDITLASECTGPLMRLQGRYRNRWYAVNPCATKRFRHRKAQLAVLRLTSRRTPPRASARVTEAQLASGVRNTVRLYRNSGYLISPAAWTLPHFVQYPAGYCQYVPSAAVAVSPAGYAFQRRDAVNAYHAAAKFIRALRPTIKPSGWRFTAC